MDHVIMGVSFEECNRRKMNYLTNGLASAALNSKFRKDFNIKYDEPLHRNNSWAAQLAKLLDLKFENRAINGSGLDVHYFNIYNDYNQGLILEDDLVLVGLTSFDRIIDFRSKEKIATLLSHNIPDEVGSKLLLEIHNDDYLVFQYFKNLILLNSLNSKIQLKMQPMTVTVLNKYRIERLNISHTKQFAEHVWNDMIDNILLPEEFLKRPEVDGVQVECGFHHPPLESHIELANKIFEKLNFNC
jgi:hypothetical protein